MRKSRSIEPLDATSGELVNFKPIGIRLSTIWHIVEGRNAWHSTWTSIYFPKAFDFSVEELKDTCEGFRTQGSVFSICAAPLAVLKSRDSILGLTPVNERDETHYAALFQDVGRGVLFRKFTSLNSDWLRCFVIKDSTKIVKGYKPHDFGSVSNGGAYRLGWIERKPREYDGFMKFYKSLRGSIRTHFEK